MLPAGVGVGHGQLGDAGGAREDCVPASGEEAVLGAASQPAGYARRREGVGAPAFRQLEGQVELGGLRHLGAPPELPALGVLVAFQQRALPLGELHVADRRRTDLLATVGGGEVAHQDVEGRAVGGQGRELEKQQVAAGAAVEAPAQSGTARDVEGAVAALGPRQELAERLVAGLHGPRRGAPVEPAVDPVFRWHLDREAHAGQTVVGGAQDLVACHHLAQRALQALRVHLAVERHGAARAEGVALAAPERPRTPLLR